MGWTEARMDTLRTMWLAGESAKRISEALGDVSRNAVMGKVDRMGLMGSAEHNSRITGRIFGACRPIAGVVAGMTPDMAPEHEPVVMEIVDVVPRGPEASPSGVVVEVVDDRGSATSAGIEPVVVEGPTSEEEPPVVVVAEEDDAAIESGSDDADVVGEDDAEDAEGDDDVVVGRPSGFDDPEEIAAEVDEEEDDEPRRRYPSIRRVDADLPPVALAPEVVRLVGGVIATVQDGSERGVAPDWRQARAVVSRLTGQEFDAKRPGHRGALVAIATILAGDPRRILCPRMGEPEVLQMMRRLATGGMIVGGKSPDRWRDPAEGDASFFDDMLTVEEVKDRWRVRIERVAAVEAEPMQIAA